ncbi:MAG: ankyrin repeat domain-containing protein [Pyrinomonadaceae bacterium]
MQSEALLAAFDGHHVEGIAAALSSGADPTQAVRGKLPIVWLLAEYHRTDRLPECLRLLIHKGATLSDEALTAVLLDDGEAIRTQYTSNSDILERRISLQSAFTSLDDVTLLHVAVEYGNFEAAKTLIELGADVNARAGVNKFGLNGHTPIFHTVNSNANRSAPIMNLLLDAGARCDIRLDGIEWGKGYEWETVFFDVTPISFAQLGLMPQVHRREADIYSNISRMLDASDRPQPTLANVPNKYLQK